MAHDHSNLNSTENFSLTSSLTTMTNNWYQNSKAPNAHLGTLFLGSIGSRVVNSIIIPTALIDTVRHTVVGIFTLGLAAPIGNLYNLIQWSLNRTERSQYSFAGGIINLMNAKKHLPNAILGTFVAIANPEKVALFFDQHEGKTKKEIEDILKNEILYCGENKGANATSIENDNAFFNVRITLSDLYKMNFNFMSKNTPLEAHEKCSLTSLLTNTTNKWYQQAGKPGANAGTLFLGSVGSRIVNSLLIFPLTTIDAINNVAIGIFTLAIGAPLSKLYNTVQWIQNRDARSKISFSGGMINIMNATNHFMNGSLATFAGTLNPEKAANFFKSSDRRTKTETNFMIRYGTQTCIDKGNDLDLSEATRNAYKEMAERLSGYLIP